MPVLLALAVWARRRRRRALALLGGGLACPLTHDYDHFRETVDGFERDHLDPTLWPDDDAKSGTRIGEALAVAVAAHGPEEFRGVQDILLLSDGDDPARDDEWRKPA